MLKVGPVLYCHRFHFERHQRITAFLVVRLLRSYGDTGSTGKTVKFEANFGSRSQIFGTFWNVT